MTFADLNIEMLFFYGGILPKITSCWRFLIFDNPEEFMQYRPKQKHQLVFFQTSACCGIWGCCSPGKLHPHASKNPMNSMDLMIWLRIFQLNKSTKQAIRTPSQLFRCLHWRFHRGGRVSSCSCLAQRRLSWRWTEGGKRYQDPYQIPPLKRQAVV